MNLHRISRTLIIILFCLSIVTPALAGSGDPDAARQAWPMIESGVLIIDVRTKEEFEDGHIEGAKQVNFDNTSALMELIGNDKNREVVFYCRTGNRAGQSIDALKLEGYEKLFNATGFKELQSTRPAHD